ncbi:hypothetical protein B0A55_08296 [Friedmanniomyces simplex]|uniref:Tyrosine specific protein phosphatases domain-containing protein n=1 Tax=Friedmanniomyces simplex TaxID=329884 RepID=A0A4U0WY10_9PEZI|nr:hypothetical protein B0A55_08296 [Friedmanniomyces simplex]
MTSPPAPVQHEPFDKIINFRDVGAYINTTTNQNLLKPGLLFRSARPDAATPRDRARLLQDYHLRTILDLRTQTEHIEARRKFTDSPPTPSAPAIAPADPKHPLRIPGIVYQDVDLNGKPYSTALLKQLSWRQKSKLYSLYLLGYRKEAISVLGENVMAQRGLAGLAEDSLEHCTAEVKAIFDVLADSKAYPVLVHCTQGKDRTGLKVLLVLMLLGNVPVEAMEADYRLSESELEPEREGKVEEIRSIGLPESFADCPAEWVWLVSGWVNERYGGVERYLEGCGVGREQQGVVRGILLAGGG